MHLQTLSQSHKSKRDRKKKKQSLIHLFYWVISERGTCYKVHFKNTTAVHDHKWNKLKLFVVTEKVQKKKITINSCDTLTVIVTHKCPQINVSTICWLFTKEIQPKCYSFFLHLFGNNFFLPFTFILFNVFQVCACEKKKLTSFGEEWKKLNEFATFLHVDCNTSSLANDTFFLHRNFSTLWTWIFIFTEICEFSLDDVTRFYYGY